MIITLKNADFSLSNIGTLTTWSVIRKLDGGSTYNGPAYVAANSSFYATVTIKTTHQLKTSGVSVIMGNTVLDSDAYSITNNIITFNIASVTGSIIISVSTEKIKEDDSENGNDATTSVTYLYNYMCNDDNGALFAASGSQQNARAVTETTFIINEGDVISTSDKTILSIAYAWQDKERKQYLGYVDCDPATSSNWNSSTFTFTNTLTVAGSSKTITYPIYVKFVFKPTSGTFTVNDIIPCMTYNVSGYIYGDGLEVEEKTVDGITYKLNYKCSDATGEIEYAGSNYPAGSRAAFETFVEVNKGDNITLSNNNIKFILYAFQTPNDVSYLGYVDTNPADSSSALKNWGNDFTFTDTLTINGTATQVNYPIYVRGVFRHADAANTAMKLNHITPFMSFNIS